MPQQQPAVHHRRLRGRPGRVAGAALLGAAVFAAGPGTTAADAKPHAPCPTGGVTLLRSSAYASPRFRVSRSGSTLRLCTRATGKRRRLTTLGTWTTATRLSSAGDRLAWTTRRTVSGAPADTVRVLDLSSGRRRLTVTRAAASPASGVPATPDTVVGLRADDLVTAWVTGSGRLAAVVGVPGAVPTPDPPAFHDGPTYVLRDVGAANAGALAAGLVLVDDSQTDDCGGTISRRLSIPAVPGAPAGGFTYYEQEAVPGPGCN